MLLICDIMALMKQVEVVQTPPARNVDFSLLTPLKWRNKYNKQKTKFYNLD